MLLTIWICWDYCMLINIVGVSTQVGYSITEYPSPKVVVGEMDKVTQQITLTNQIG